MNALSKAGRAAFFTATVITAALLAPARASATVLSMEAYQPVLWGSPAVSSQFVEYSLQVLSSGLGSDQMFANVTRDDGTWVVQNLPVGFEPGTSTLSTNIDSNLFRSGAAYQTTLSALPVLAAPGFTAGVPLALG